MIFVLRANCRVWDHHRFVTVAELMIANDGVILIAYYAVLRLYYFLDNCEAFDAEKAAKD